MAIRYLVLNGQKLEIPESWPQYGIAYSTEAAAEQAYLDTQAPWYPFYDPALGVITWLRYSTGYGSPEINGYSIIHGGPKPDDIPWPPIRRSANIQGQPLTTPSTTTAPPSGTTTTPPPGTTGPPSCGPGEVWDSVTRQCMDAMGDLGGFVVQGSAGPGSSAYGVNPQDTSSNPFSSQVGLTGPGGRSGGGGIGSATINATIDITEQGIDHVATAVQNAIDAAATEAANQSFSTTSKITDALNYLESSITGQTNNATNGLTAVLNRATDLMEQQVTDQTTVINDAIGAVESGAKAAIDGAVLPVEGQVSALGADVDAILTRVVAPIESDITRSITEIADTSTQVDKDVRDAIEEFSSLPKDLSDELGSLDATLNRTISQASTVNKTVVESTLGGSKDDTVWTRLNEIGGILAKAAGGDRVKTTFETHTELTDPGVSAALSKSFDAIWGEIYTFVTKAFSGFGSFAGAFKALPLAIPFIAEAEWELPAAMIGFVLAMLEAYRPALKYIEEDVAKKAGLAKLAPADALQAWLRNFITLPELREELGARGWDAGRIDTLVSLQTYLIDIATALDMYHRDVIDEKDLRENMGERGITAEQQDAIITSSYKLFGVGTATEGFLQEHVGLDRLRDILSYNRFTTEEAEVYIASLIKKEGVNASISNLRTSSLVSGGIVNDTAYTDTPSAVMDATRRAGAGIEDAKALWRSSFSIPTLQTFIDLHFRGLRSEAEIQTVMDYYHVPSELRTDFVDSLRPLIPYRVIPAMLAGDIIDELRAKKELAAHGYTEERAQLLIDYAQGRANKSKHITMQHLKDLSLSTAKDFWLEKTFSDGQYRDVLLAHGYDDEMATLEINTVKLHEHAKERKQAAADIIAEAQAGLITRTEAQTLFANMGFTAGEMARYLNRLHVNKRTAAKTPSEADLLKLHKAKIIDDEDYKDGLIALGYPPRWVVALYALNIKGPFPGSESLQ